jgi:hypothetical protein
MRLGDLSFRRFDDFARRARAVLGLALWLPDVVGGGVEGPGGLVVCVASGYRRYGNSPQALLQPLIIEYRASYMYNHRSEPW